MKCKFIDKLGQLKQHKQMIDLSCQNTKCTLMKFKTTIMKKALALGILLFSSLIICGQSLDTLYVKNCQDITWTSLYRNSDRFKTIKFEDDSALNLEGVIKIGRPSGTNTSQVVNSGLFNSTVQQQNNFSYLMLGRMGIAVMGGITYLPENLKGLDAKIIEIKIVHSGFSKNSLASPVLILEINGVTVSVLNYKLAFENGELINPNRPMNRSEAIAVLKEQKDLFDLGMITKEQFEAKKEEFGKFIK